MDIRIERLLHKFDRLGQQIKPGVSTPGGQTCKAVELYLTAMEQIPGKENCFY